MKNKVVAMILFVFIIIEGYFSFYFKKEEIEPVVIQEDLSKKYSFTDVLQYLNNNTIEVKNIYKSGEDYIINGDINDKNDEFLEKIQKIDRLELLDYTLDLKGDSINGNFTFKYS